MTQNNLRSPTGWSASLRVLGGVLAVFLVGCGNSPSAAGTGAGGGSPASGGGVASGGMLGPGGRSATGGSTASRDGAVATDAVGLPTGGAMTGAGGATTGTGTVTGTGGVRAGTGGASAGRGGAPAGQGGKTAGQGGKTTGAGGTARVGGSTGAGGATTGSGGSTGLAPNAIYVAPNGSASAAGTLDNPTTLANAAAKVSAGGTIYLRGGTYALGSTVNLAKSGSASATIDLLAYPLDANRPLLDFSSQATGSRGVSLSGSYWHVYGIDIAKAGDNCMFVSGSHNTLEHMTFSECEDSGLQLGNGAANNVVVNCDSFFNADASRENADGFAAKLDVGTGNKFVGCRAWNNLDDGWDGYLRGADNVATSYESCWAIDNGKLKDGSVGAGDGNGFKSGGSDDKDLRHDASYLRCIAAGNVHDGFDHNSNRGNVTIRNSAAHANGSNINFSATNSAASLTIKNTISLGTSGSLQATTTNITNNSWQNGLSATDADFVSVDTALLKAKRKSDGSLPDIAYLELVPGSDLRNAGVDVGLPYGGSAPDLGPFESEE